MRNIYSKYPLVTILIMGVMAFINIGIIQYSFNIGHAMTAKHSVLVDATMESKFEITQAHLWLEEFIGGDSSIQRHQIRKNLDEAKWYLNAMLYGGANHEGVFIPVDSKYSLLINTIKESLKLVDVLQLATHSRVIDKNNREVGSASDIEYDALYTNTILKIDEIETSLQKMIAQDLEYYYWMKNILIFLVVLTNVFILISYKTILKFQKEWLFKYFKVESQKDKLEKLYKEIKDAQMLIDKYVPLSRTDLEGKITYANKAMCEISGYTLEELVGKNHRIIRYPDEKKEKYEELWKKITSGSTWEGEVKNISKYGETYWINVHIHPILNERNIRIGYQALRENITHKKELEFLASNDSLTNIYNRNKFDTLLEYEIEQWNRYEKTFSMAIFDLDHFKNVNDTYGHQVGDYVLVESVNIMKASIRKSDVLARWGGEEFILLLPHTNRDEAEIVVEKIRESIDKFLFDKVNHITISCGFSEVIKDDTSYSILKRVDDALYEAKNTGRNKILFL